MKLVKLPLIAGALLAFATSATAQWSDNFDSYANLTVLNGVGGWGGWNNVPAVAGKAVNTFARSASNSLKCDGANLTDAVHPGLGITTGKWRFTAWQYISSADAPGDVFFIVNNVYVPNGAQQWTTELHCSGGFVSDDFATGGGYGGNRTGTPQPLVPDTWAEFRADIDLDANAVAYYYNGALVSQGTWTGPWSGGGGPVAIENLDLYSSGGTCYWDDVVLEHRAPRDIVVLNANGDGFRDLATANSGTNDVSLYLNSGTGTFPSSTYVAVTGADTGVIALAAGNLGGAGFDGLAVACSTSNTVCRITNLNTVPVATSMPIPGLLNPVDVAVGNLDAGTAGDIVVACKGTLFGPGGIAVSLNGGPFTIVSIGTYVKVVVGDLDGDGDNDIAAVAQGSPDRIDLFRNTGGGVFVPAGSILLSTTGFASGLCCSDMDGVNGNDLVSLTPNPFVPSNSLNVHKNTGTGPLGPGRFTTVGPIATPGVLAIDVACGDFEQDTIVCGGNVLFSRMDLLVVNAGLGAPTSHHGFNGLTFQSTQSELAGTNPIACVVADFNNDGQDDLAIANQGSDDITVKLTAPTPLADVYGTGCPGTASLVPLIGHSGGLPSSGNPSFAVTLAQANASSLAGLLLSLSCDNAPLGGGCTIYLGAPVVTYNLLFTNGAGNATQPFPIPVSPSFQGLDAFMQWAVFDPNGAFANTLAFSGGLRIQIGQ